MTAERPTRLSVVREAFLRPSLYESDRFSQAQTDFGVNGTGPVFPLVFLEDQIITGTLLFY